MLTDLPESLRASATVCFHAGGPCARYAGSTSAPISWPYIVAGKRVAFRAMRLELIRQAAFPDRIEQVFALTPEEEMGWVDALPVVAGMTDDAAFWYLAGVMEPPGESVRADLPTVDGGEASIAPLTEKPRPRPTPVGLFNLQPKLGFDIHGLRTVPIGIDQSKRKWWENLQLAPDSQLAKHSWSTPKRTAL